MFSSGSEQPHRFLAGRSHGPAKRTPPGPIFSSKFRIFTQFCFGNWVFFEHFEKKVLEEDERLASATAEQLAPPRPSYPKFVQIYNFNKIFELFQIFQFWNNFVEKVLPINCTSLCARPRTSLPKRAKKWSLLDFSFTINFMFFQQNIGFGRQIGWKMVIFRRRCGRSCRMRGSSRAIL